jgi:hypothetical protein
MEKPLFVAFHTPDDFYSNMAERLRQSLVRFGLDHHIEQHENAGSWAKCCWHKAYFILGMLSRFYNRDIVYLDADAEMKAYPDRLFNLAADIAFVENEQRQPISSMVYFKNNDASRLFVCDWIKMNKKFPDFPCADQENFGSLVRVREMEGMTVTYLPITYNFERNITRRIGEPVVIYQHIASRLGIVPDFETIHGILAQRIGYAPEFGEGSHQEIARA